MEAKAKERELLARRASGKVALDHAIGAADLYMQAASQASSPAEKSRLKQKCSEMIKMAEGLKGTPAAVDNVRIVEQRLQMPRMVRDIPTKEKNILYRGSRLHGNIFPPWENDPASGEFEGHSFIDPSVYSLSDRQQTIFGGWKRPLELIAKDGEAEANTITTHMMEPQDDYDLVQDVTTDCSVVASLCASMRHLQSGPKSILPAHMFPADVNFGKPRISSNGKYIFRMYFNGCFRRVVIDDRLPSSSNDRTLYVVDRHNPKLLWPALMEKAYLKVRGGYDFPGSNSGTDLWVLTGWIPQQIFLQSDELEFDHTWKRIKKAYDFGDVVITLGTGRLSVDEEEASGLVGEHDYAVLDLSESGDSRRMLVKNPWCDGMTWKGVGSSAASASSDSSDGDARPKLKPGTFWISFDDVAQNFESLYLNWNPSLFTERQDHHFTWELPEPTMAGSFAHNPQYSMSSSADGMTWILLSRHFQDEELEIARKRGTTLASTSNQLGFMSLYIFENNGARVQLSDKSIYRGPFVDSPQTLAPFEAKKGVKYTIVVASHDLPLPKYSFTLSFFSRSSLTIDTAAHSLKHYTETKSSWTRRTAGGNAGSATYLQNPQFSVKTSQTGPLSLLLSTSREELHVHIDLVWANGQRVTAVTVRDLVATSGEYRRGCAQACVPSLEAGTYTIVCSTYEPGALADFTLRIGSNAACVVAPVLADAAGRLRTRLPDLALPAGGELTQRAPVTVARLSRASFVITRKHKTLVGGGGGSSASGSTSNTGSGAGGTGTPRAHPTVRVRLESGRGPDRTMIPLTSGDGREFKEVGLGGLRTAEVDIDPRLTRSRDGLWLVVEQHMMGASPRMYGDDGLTVELLSDGHVGVGPWEVLDD
ncbi:PALB protein [Microdochium trichocladiopsis]|uniref:PALB protein n=1 Tax=Microdochium trichocladiopsis TaxID=1682393 RepID=A0A9P8YFN9_9PEZI|nr:PALB protein [Microdochium trichocladiopsis]KAH7038042.1 PALB protein [Microdochium trichocladiopsis]